MDSSGLKDPQTKFFDFIERFCLSTARVDVAFPLYIVETRYLYKMAVSGRLLKFTRGSLRYKIMVGSPPKNTAHNL